MCLLENGVTIGEHVVDGSIVFTRVEIMNAQLGSLIFRRELCSAFGLRELESIQGLTRTELKKTIHLCLTCVTNL